MREGESERDSRTDSQTDEGRGEEGVREYILNKPLIKEVDVADFFF